MLPLAADARAGTRAGVEIEAMLEETELEAPGRTLVVTEAGVGNDA